MSESMSSSCLAQVAKALRHERNTIGAFIIRIRFL